MSLTIKIFNFIKKIFILQILCLKILIAQENDYRANPEKDSQVSYMISTAISDKYMIVCADVRAAKAARKIIEEGGNALDAVIAAQNVLSVVEPQSSGLGGGGFLLYFDKKTNKLEAYDGREFAPSSAHSKIFLNNNNHKLNFMNAITKTDSVGIPGLYNMLADAHKEYGFLKWEHLFHDSLTYSKGFIVSKRLSKLLEWGKHIKTDEYAIKIYYADNKPKREGDIIKNDKLYFSLKELSKNAYSIKNGKLAVLISEKLKKKITLEDLKSWETIKREPLCKKYFSYFICGFPPPTSGGVGVLQILGILENFKNKKNLLVSQHLFLEASRLSYNDRDVFIADPKFFDVPVDGLLSKDYLQRRANLINTFKSNHKTKSGNPYKSSSNKMIQAVSRERPSTTHISIVDKYGNVAALTSSIEFAFGSGKTVGGFFLNNQLTDFSFNPYDQNQKKVANAVRPFKKPRSTMSPTIVFNNNEIIGVLGSPGGSRIICYVAKTLFYVLNAHMSPSQAISSPHICSRNKITEIEERKDADKLSIELKTLGHIINRKKMTSGINMIWKKNKSWLGVADPRREGVAITNEIERKE